MEIKYKLIRAKRKTVGIKVTNDGEVVVRAPKGLPAKEIDRIIEKHLPWIERKLSEAEKIKDEELTEEDIEILRTLCERLLLERVEYYSHVTGLAPEKVRISRAKNRFGSCSSKGSVSLSLYVMLYPKEAWDLVVVHELCHLRYMNHSKEFYSLLSSFLPDHKERKKLLKREKRLTMAELRIKYGELL